MRAIVGRWSALVTQSFNTPFIGGSWSTELSDCSGTALTRVGERWWGGEGLRGGVSGIESEEERGLGPAYLQEREKAQLRVFETMPQTQVVLAQAWIYAKNEVNQLQMYSWQHD